MVRGRLQTFNLHVWPASHSFVQPDSFKCYALVPGLGFDHGRRGFMLPTAWMPRHYLGIRIHWDTF